MKRKPGKPPEQVHELAKAVGEVLLPGTSYHITDPGEPDGDWLISAYGISASGKTPQEAFAAFTAALANPPRDVGGSVPLKH
jgi:hypothetical protein